MLINSLFLALETQDRYLMPYIDGLVQDCSNSIALAMELLQSCMKPSIYFIENNRTIIARLWHNNLHAD